MKLSKILYAIVNEILPVPQQVLNQVYQKYDQFIESEQLYCIIPIQMNDKKLQNYYPQPIAQYFKMNFLTVALVKSDKISGGFNFNNKSPNNVQINCIATIGDKDAIQHELKHYFKYWFNIFSKKHSEQLNKFYNLQFETYITDFCNLMTQIYKRLNRRFNVSLDTIIQKVVIDVVDNKTNINKYKKLLNGSSEFDCYKKCISLLQLYKGIENNVDKKLFDVCKTTSNINEFEDINKYNQFFTILKKHINKNVKKSKQYNIVQLIEDSNLKQLNLCIQKRVVQKQHLDDILQLFIKNNKQDYLINVAISYKLNEEQLAKIEDNLNQLNKTKFHSQAK